MIPFILFCTINDDIWHRKTIDHFQFNFIFNFIIFLSGPSKINLVYPLTGLKYIGSVSFIYFFNKDHRFSKEKNPRLAKFKVSQVSGNPILLAIYT